MAVTTRDRFDEWAASLSDLVQTAESRDEIIAHALRRSDKIGYERAQVEFADPIEKAKQKEWIVHHKLKLRAEMRRMAMDWPELKETETPAGGRKEGFYHVLRNGQKEVAEWHRIGGWKVMGTAERVTDEDMDGIGQWFAESF